MNDNQDEKGFEPEEQPGRKVRIQQQRRLTWREEGGVGAVLSPSECDEYIRIFEYSNKLVTNIYSDIRSYQIFFYEYIRTFVRVKFVCTNIFGHSLVSVLECKT